MIRPGKLLDLLSCHRPEKGKIDWRITHLSHQAYWRIIRKLCALFLLTMSTDAQESTRHHQRLTIRQVLYLCFDFVIIIAVLQKIKQQQLGLFIAWGKNWQHETTLKTLETNKVALCFLSFSTAVVDNSYT